MTCSATPPHQLTVRLASARSVVAVALLFAVNGPIVGGLRPARTPSPWR